MGVQLTNRVYGPRKIFWWTLYHKQCLFLFYLGKPQKKFIFLVAGPLREGGGAKRLCCELFFNVRKKVPMATRTRGAKALVAGPLGKELFLRLPLRILILKNFLVRMRTRIIKPANKISLKRTINKIAQPVNIDHDLFTGCRKKYIYQENG